MQSHHFLSFSSSNLVSPRKRIERQALESQFFDGSITIATELDLDAHFCATHADKLLPTVRGFGYWIWKPQIILQKLQTMPEDDLLCYTDVGCTLRKEGHRLMTEWFGVANDQGLLCFNAASHPLPDGTTHTFFPEYAWTKGNLFDYLVTRHNPEVTQTAQIGAGVLILRNTSKTRTLIKDWLAVFELAFHTLDDSASTTPNLPGFIESRHDQSVLSCLIKLSGCYTPLSSCYYAPLAALAPAHISNKYFGGISWLSLRQSPIWATRDLGSWRAHIPMPLKYIHQKLANALRKR